MRSAPHHPDETHRISALRRLGLLDTPAEERFDRITRLAASLLDTPIALVSLVDEHRQWFKSRVGIDATETPRELAFCAHAVAEPGLTRLVVPDATADERFFDNPLVTAEPNVRFYAGQVLHSPDGMPVGTLCVIDDRPRDLDESTLAVLADLGAMVEDELRRSSELDVLVQLDASERSKSIILDTLQEGLVLHGSDGRIVEWNRRAEEVLGLTGDQLAGRTSMDPRWQSIRPDGSPWDGADHPAMVSLATGDSVRNQTMGIRRPDGSQVWLRINSEPVRDESGEVVGALATFADITVELNARTASAALTERLRVAVDRSPLGTGLIDQLGRLSYVNDAYGELVGLDPEAMLGRLAIDFVHPDDATIGQAELLELAQGSRDQVELELRVLAADGDVKHVKLHVTRLKPATSTAAFFVQVEDVTTHHQLASALRFSEEVSRASLTALDEGVILIDETARVHLINRAAEQMLGMDAATVGEHWRSGRLRSYAEDGRLLEPDERPIARALTTRQPVRREVVGLDRSDGRRILVEVSCLPTTLDDGVPGLVLAFADVTERRELERQLERYGHLFRHANDVILVIGRDAKLRWASPSAARLLGRPDEGPSSGGVLESVHPDDRDAARVELDLLIAGTREEHPFTVRVVDGHGTWRSLECVGVNLLHEPAVDGVVLTARDVTERQRLLDELAHRATHDLLTELPNRAGWASHLDGAVGRSSRSGARIGLCYLDLDGFKTVNDSLGHATGDQLLVEVGRRIRAAIRQGDVAARIGGDEFVVLLDPVDDTFDAHRMAERLRDAVLGDDDLTVGGVRCGVSIGVAVGLPGEEPDDLQARADAALYVAKAKRCRAIVVAPDEERSVTTASR